MSQSNGLVLDFQEEVRGVITLPRYESLDIVLAHRAPEDSQRTIFHQRRSSDPHSNTESLAVELAAILSAESVFFGDLNREQLAHYEERKIAAFRHFYRFHLTKVPGITWGGFI